MAIFSFLARIGLDTAQFEAGVKRAQSSAAGLGKSIKGHLGGEVSKIGSALAGIFTVGAVNKFASSVVQMTTEIKDMADLLGVSTDEVQKLMKAADDAAQPFSKVVSALQRVEGLRSKAITGDERAKSIFSILGIDPGQGNAFEILQKTVNASKLGAEQNAAAFELLGAKVGGLKRVVDELQQQGPIKLLSQEDIDAIDELEKQWKNLKRDFLVSAVSSGEAGFWARVVKRGREVDEQRPGVMNFALSTAIGEEIFSAITRGSEVRGIDMSPLPIPEGRSRLAGQSSTDQDAAIALLREMTQHARKTAEVLENNANR